MSSTIVAKTRAAVRVPFLDLQTEYSFLRDAGLETRILATLAAGHHVEGAAVREFESAFARYCGVEKGVAVDSGTAALHLALLALGIGPEDEVLVPANTFIATAAPVVHTGARPVFVDADASSWQMDVACVRERIGPRCRAIIAVHLYGQPVDLNPLLRLCAERGLHLIEDAAQAHGARYRSQRIGSFGKISCFSFYPSKNLGAFGDGGMVLTNDAALADRVRRLRNHGRINRYEHAEVGFNFRMDELQGTVLHAKLAYLDEWNQRRRDLAASYHQRLAGLPVVLPVPVAEGEPVHNLFPILCRDRDSLASFLAARQIETGVHYPLPLPLQPAFRELGHQPGNFPVAEKIASETLSLPLSPWLSGEQFAHVCDSIAEFFEAEA